MPLLELNQLHTRFTVRTGWFGRARRVHAVNGVSLEVYPGETVGLVGESGCGKSSLVRTVLGLENPTDGTIHFEGRDVTRARGAEQRRLRRGIQMVFQDPFGSLNPVHRVELMLDEVLRAHFPQLNQAARRTRQGELMERVGLDPDYLTRFPHQLSGGQRQRVGLARALAVEPRLLLADEPVSALDVSVQAQIIGLFKSLQRELGVACLFISHDLAVVEHLCQRVLVMYLGRLVEEAPVEMLFRQPRHPYTRALLAAVPRLPGDVVHPEGSSTWVTGAEIPSPLKPPSGCPFQTRCPLAQPLCQQEVPVLRQLEGRHQAACHFAS